MQIFKNYSSSNEQFWDTFPWQDFFPDISLTIPWLLTTSLTFPWHVPSFPDKWSPCTQFNFLMCLITEITCNCAVYTSLQYHNHFTVTHDKTFARTTRRCPIGVISLPQTTTWGLIQRQRHKIYLMTRLRTIATQQLRYHKICLNSDRSCDRLRQVLWIHLRHVVNVLRTRDVLRWQ